MLVCVIDVSSVVNQLVISLLQFVMIVGTKTKFKIRRPLIEAQIKLINIIVKKAIEAQTTQGNVVKENKMPTIQGLDLRARNATGQEIEFFKVQWIGKVAFGVINEHATDKAFLELFVPKLEAENKQLNEALNTYGNHLPNCAYVQGLKGGSIEDCDCGFEQTLIIN